MDVIISLMQRFPSSGLEKLKDVYQSGINDASLREQLTNLFSSEIPSTITDAFYEGEELNVLITEYAVGDAVEETDDLSHCNTRIVGSELNYAAIFL